MRIEDFVPVAAIEAFDVGVLVRFAGLNVVSRRALPGDQSMKVCAVNSGPLSTRKERLKAMLSSKVVGG